jgi:hypothetical protein
MRKKHGESFKVLLLIGAAVIFCHSRYALAADIEHFSSEMVSRSAGQSENARIYVSGDKMRTEAAGAIIIIRLDKNVMWMVMPSQQMYMEHPIDLERVPKTSKDMEGEVGRESLGEDLAAGVQAEKFKVTYRNGVMYQWLLDSGFPVKMESDDGGWSVEYRNISFGPQPDSLFEVPAGFQKVFLPFTGGAADTSLEGIMSQIGE